MGEADQPGVNEGPAATAADAQRRPAKPWPINRFIYSLAWYLATPLIAGYLLWRARRQSEYLHHWNERFGFVARRRRRGKPLVWVHAVSVGETRAAEPLIRALRERYPNTEWLLTCTTPTGRETGRALFGDTVRRAYLPYDYPTATRRFLKAWGPALGIVMETELWPNLTAQARRQRVPMAAVSVRLSERSLRRGERGGPLIRDALARLDTVVAQGREDAERLSELGRSNAIVVGNLKFDVTPSATLLALGARWRTALAGRPVLLAASTRDGEEVLLLDAWLRTSGVHSTAMPSPSASALAPSCTTRPLLAIVPRHPQRFDDVAALCAQRGLSAVRRSELSDSFAGVEADVLIGDSMGEMFAYYAMADVAIIGGSLLRYGAQNLIEASAVGVPVVIGPHSFNFKEATLQAIEAGAALRAQDADDAVTRACSLLNDRAAWQAMHEAALKFAATHRGATERTMAALAPLLERCLGQPVERTVFRSSPIAAAPAPPFAPVPAPADVSVLSNGSAPAHAQRPTVDSSREITGPNG